MVLETQLSTALLPEPVLPPQYVATGAPFELTMMLRRTVLPLDGVPPSGPDRDAAHAGAVDHVRLDHRVLGVGVGLHAEVGDVVDQVVGDPVLDRRVDVDPMLQVR